MLLVGRCVEYCSGSACEPDRYLLELGWGTRVRFHASEATYILLTYDRSDLLCLDGQSVGTFGTWSCGIQVGAPYIATWMFGDPHQAATGIIPEMRALEASEGHNAAAEADQATDPGMCFI